MAACRNAAAKVAAARKLVVILHAMWKTNQPFRRVFAAACSKDPNT
jgi:hypothetical protein